MFKEKKYEIVKNAISYELANFIFNYLLLRRDAVEYMYKNNYTLENVHYGTWKDKQVPGVYSEYSDMVMETLMMKVLPIMKEKTGLALVPTYSYTRVYENGSVLKKHKDRPSCEISSTVNLGGDIWPIFVSGVQVDLTPGDMLIYSGCDLEHWRDKFEGNLCGQAFLHYNNIDGEYGDHNVFDNRPLLGLPSYCKNKF